MAQIIFENGAEKQRLFPLTGATEFVGGRSGQVALTINDPFCSERHFRLRQILNGAWQIEDLNSTNGVAINGWKISAPLMLADNDVIRVGNSYLRLRLRDDAAAIFPDLPGYEFSAQIGISDTGAIYKARRQNQEVAVKVSYRHQGNKRQRQEFCDLFMQRARAAQQLQHENLVRVIDAGINDGRIFFTMEYIAGETVAKKLSQVGTFNESSSIHIATSIAVALEYMETQGFSYSQIQPNYVFITDTNKVKLSGLGITRLPGGNEIMGLPHYASPEQAMGQPTDIRSAFYSLGCVLFRMLAGRAPFAGAAAQDIMRGQISKLPPRLSAFIKVKTPTISALVSRLLEKRVAARFQTAAELLSALNQVKDEIENARSSQNCFISETIPLDLGVTEVGQPAHRQTLLIWIIAAGVVLLALGGWYFLHQ